MFPLDKFKLQLSNSGIKLPSCLWNKNKRTKIEKLYSESNKRIEKMLDLKKLVKSIRMMKTLLEHSLLTESIKNKIKNVGNHYIDLEESDCECEGENIDDVSHQFSV